MAVLLALLKPYALFRFVAYLKQHCEFFWRKLHDKEEIVIVIASLILNVRKFPRIAKLKFTIGDAQYG